jgi:hypothetical protein
MATPIAAVHAINQALKILESALEPLFVKSLHETLEDQNTLEQAKLCAMLPYVVDQLITSRSNAQVAISSDPLKYILEPGALIPVHTMSFRSWNE